MTYQRNRPYVSANRPRSNAPAPARGFTAGLAPPHAAAKHPDEMVLGHRFGEEITLADVAADALQPIGLAGRLDTLGYGFQAEAHGQLDDGLTQPAVDLVGVAISDVGAIAGSVNTASSRLIMLGVQ